MGNIGLNEPHPVNYVFDLSDVVKYLHDFAVGCSGYEIAEEAITGLTHCFVNMSLNGRVRDSDKDYIDCLLDYSTDMEVIYSLHNYVMRILSHAIIWFSTHCLDNNRLGLLYIRGNIASIVSIKASTLNDDLSYHLIESTVCDEYDENHDSFI